MTARSDFVAEYARSVGITVTYRTVLVEGTSDVAIFELASDLLKRGGNPSPIDGHFSIVAAGEYDQGGTYGVMRELFSLRSLARAYLDHNGRPYYRFVALIDNDYAGRQALQAARLIDRSLIEYRDIFRLWPNMPVADNRDPTTVRLAFESANSAMKGLDWEIEDCIDARCIARFEQQYSGGVLKSVEKGGRVHRELSRDGKVQLHRFVKSSATSEDLAEFIKVLRAIRFYVGLSSG